jgi:hypothetical protein
MSDHDDALRAREAERDRSCGAGADLHAELLPLGHPLHDVLPTLDDHPQRRRIEAARDQHTARRALRIGAGRRGIPWATWVPGIPNYTPGRAGHNMYEDPRFIVLHTMVGWESSARARFMQPAQQASSTYGITLKGELVQYVDERDGPWTNGTIYGPVGGNLDSITIEHEDGGDYNGPRTPELYAASARAVRNIADEYGIPLDRSHVVYPHELGHRECSDASTACPDSLDLDRIIREALGGGSSSNTTSGGSVMGATMGGFVIGDVFHQFETSQKGTVLWGRTTGGPGGHTHVDWWDMGNGGVPLVDMSATHIPGDVDWIVLRAKHADGGVVEKLLRATESDPAKAVEWDWYEPDHHGPFGVPAAGAKGDPGPPGDGADDAHIEEVALTAIAEAAAAAVKGK